MMFKKRREIKKYLKKIENIVYNRFTGYIGKQKYFIVGNNVWRMDEDKMRKTSVLFTEMDRIVEHKGRK